MANITIRGLRKRFGRTEIVHGIDLDIRDGEFVVILGPSGCGKSTLLRLIAGLEEINGGEVAIGGKVVNRLEPRERGCAMVFQNYALYPHMTVADNIGYALKVARVDRRERAERIMRVAKTLGLDDLLDRKPAALSGGQRQRVAMGRAMIREPSVFLFDEPLSNLDAKLRVQMRVEIKRLHHRLAATSIFVTHDQVEAMTLADRLIVMNEGRIEQVGAPAEVYNRPCSRYVAGFIGSPAMNFFEARVRAPEVVAVADGRELRVPANAGLPAHGKPVVLGIRPEDMQVVAASSEAFKFEIEMMEELGAGRLLYGRLASTDCVVATPATTVLADAKLAFVRIPPEAIHLFDAESGARIEPTAGFLSAGKQSIQDVGGSATQLSVGLH
jgi:sn-glycerol 3-phosphate transport system ATP-binding protein